MKRILLPLFLIGAIASQAQTYFSEDFGSVDSIAVTTNWNNIDNNNDNELWYGNTNSIDASYGISATSASWKGSPITPDNMITTKLPIDLTNASAGVFIQWEIGNQYDVQAWWEEKYSVYITDSSNTDSVINSTPIFTEILPEGNKMLKRSINLDAFIGKEVFISFRHYDCIDKFQLILDNIKVKQVAANEAHLVSINLLKHDTLNASHQISGTISNNGAQAINNLTVTWTDGTNSYQDIITTPILPFTNFDFTHSTPYIFNSIQIVDLTVYIDLAMDTLNINDTLSTQVAALSSIVPKNVVGEEATGTWCTWCPRGAVSMNQMEIDHPTNWIGIAVHNNDPMAVADYDLGISDYISGYPSGTVNRLHMDKDPTEFDQIFGEEIKKLPIASVKIENHNWDAANATVSFDVTSTFVTNSSDPYRLAAIIVEDHVTGTTSGYDQVNAYAGGANGPMGGYENLTDPVPADQMIYNHVGRALLGGFHGVMGSIYSPVADGQMDSHSFTYTFPADHITNNSHIVGLLLSEKTGQIINAVKMDVVPTGITDLEAQFHFRTFPNPASTQTTINFTLVEAMNVQLNVIDAMGKTIHNKNYNTVNIGTHAVLLNTANLPNGLYFIVMRANNQIIKKPLVIQH